MASMNRLSAKKAQAASAGKIADGMGLRLFKREDGRGQWVLRVTVYGRRREMGLGAWPEVSLAEARSTAEDARAEVRKGLDPILERERKRQEAKHRRFICRVKPSRAALAVQPCILMRMTKRVLRSTTVPIAERLKAPLIRSPSCQLTGDACIAERPMAGNQACPDLFGTMDTPNVSGTIAEPSDCPEPPPLARRLKRQTSGHGRGSSLPIPPMRPPQHRCNSRPPSLPRTASWPALPRLQGQSDQ
jgi:hypothetical protein